MDIEDKIIYGDEMVGHRVGIARIPCLYMIRGRGVVDCSIRVGGNWLGGYYNFYLFQPTLSTACFFEEDTWR